MTEPDAIQSLVLRVLTCKARGHEQHVKAAAAITELRAIGSQVVTLPDGRKYTVQDNFAGNSAKKTVFLDRYELREVK